MKVIYHHQKKTAVWEDADLTGAQYMIDYLLDIWKYHNKPVPLTPTGPDVFPSMWTHEGATAAGLVAGYYMTGDQCKVCEVPEGSVP